MSASLVGSEMCIRDSLRAPESSGELRRAPFHTLATCRSARAKCSWPAIVCLLYTSDAADDM
eukprot:2458555-Alexandrium_andersonii.AAC.1